MNLRRKTTSIDHLLNISEVESVGIEAKKGTDTTISCVITGLTSKVIVFWRNDKEEVSEDNFNPSQGTYDASTGEQISTLTVKGAQVKSDTTFTCRVSSDSYPESDHSDTTVDLKVIGTFPNISFF